ncbi:hypothetical protein MRS44_015759 [Fusarium solani]|uniref:uncharacterized protein n=1 Tax=Fusarium solani TaxID=169388 RepID=UPI0032C4502B|nr:hypothetical protein MRS44_015759 [Fusarium solani]
MDPPGCSSEPAELDHTLLDFDPDSLLDAWVDDLLAAEDHSAQPGDRPIAMPPENVFSNMDTSFGGSEPALATGFGMTRWIESIGYIAAHDYITGPLDHFQASEMSQDCVTGLGPSTTNHARAATFSMFDSSVLQQLCPMDFQFSAEGDDNNPSHVAVQDLSFPSCPNSTDLQEAAANISSDVVFPLRNSMVSVSGFFGGFLLCVFWSRMYGPPSAAANVWLIQPIGSRDLTPQTHDTRTAHNIQRPENQLVNAPGASQNAAPSPLAPASINHQGLRPNIATRKLPPKRRGGRRGKLSASQALKQRETKLSGACIRCRKCRIGWWYSMFSLSQDLGEIANLDNALYESPVPGYHRGRINLSFTAAIMKEIALFKNTNIRSMMTLMGPLKTLLQQEADQYVVIQSKPEGQTIALPWAVGGRMLVSIFGDLHQDPCNWTRPSFSKVASTLADFLRRDASGRFFKLTTETAEPYTPEWARSIIVFCQSSSYRQPPQSTINSTLPQFPKDDAGRLTSSLVSWTGWVTSRYFELYLFRYLQVLSNDTSFDSVEDQKSYIMCLVDTLLLSAFCPQSIHKDSMDEKDPRTVSLYRDVFDRQSRVHSALWVYCSVAIRGLPAWSSIWDTIGQRWPLLQGETMAQLFQNDLAAFNASLADNYRSAYNSLRHFEDYGSLLSTMNPILHEEFDDETENEVFLHDGRLLQLYRLGCTNKLDQWIGVYDQQTTGGVLTAQTASQKRVASTRAFAALAIIDWRRRPIHAWNPKRPIEAGSDFLESFIRKVLERLVSIDLYDECTELCPAGTPLEEFFTSKTAKKGTSTAMQMYNDRVQCLIRRGRRWRELKDMVGLGVVLIHDPLRHFRSDLQTFYIPSIVEDGTERQFTRLKEIIPTRLQWLAEVCIKLRGLVPMLVAASTAERENATVIRDQMQAMIITAFGSRSSVEEALLSSWAQQDLFPRGLAELLRPEAATIPLDIKVGMSLCLLNELDTKEGWKPGTWIDFEMMEDVCHEAEGIMERDCSTLDSGSRRELRVWSHKVLDFIRNCPPVDMDSQASG